MSLHLSPNRGPGTRFPDLKLGKHLRIDPDAEVFDGRKTLKDATDLKSLGQPIPSQANYLRPDEPLDPVLRHHLRR